MRRLRRTKIVATLGPASSSPEMIGKLFAAGADVFRINMSHTSPDRMRELVAMIRGVERDTDRPIAILVDLQGPKLRLGTFQGGSANVKIGDTFVLDSDPAAGDATRAFLQRHNPHALHAICERLLEAIQRGLWQRPGAQRAQLEHRLLEAGQHLEGSGP